MSAPFVLAVPSKGRLQENTEAFFARAGLKLSKTYDLAEFVATAIANVRDAILIGSVLAVIVLLVFLRDWRLTLVAAITLTCRFTRSVASAGNRS